MATENFHAAVSIAVIVGPVVVVLSAAIIATVCICRRRRAAASAGVVVHRDQSPMVVQQSTMMNQSGAVATSGAQPGVIYPSNPHYPDYSPNYGYPGQPGMALAKPTAPEYQPQHMPYIQNQNQLLVN